MEHADREVLLQANAEQGGNYTVTVNLKYSKVLNAYIVEQGELEGHEWSKPCWHSI